MRFLFSLALITFFLSGNAQDKSIAKKYTWTDLLKAMSSSDTSELIIGEKDNIIIDASDFSLFGKPKFEKASPSSLKDGRLIIKRKITFSNPTISAYQGALFSLNSLCFKKNLSIIGKFQSLIIKNSILENGLYIDTDINLGASMTTNNLEHNLVLIARNEIIGQVVLNLSSEVIQVGFNKFDYQKETKPVIFEKLITGSTSKVFFDSVCNKVSIYDQIPFLPDRSVTINMHEGKNVGFKGNTFLASEVPLINLSFDNIEKLEFNNNQFDTNLAISGTVTSKFLLSNNNFQKRVSITDLIYPPHSELDWSNLISKITYVADTMVSFMEIPSKYFEAGGASKIQDLTYNDSTTLHYFFEGKNYHALRKEKNYKKMIETYKLLFDLYKSKGDLKSSNGVFVAAKDLEGARLEAIYKYEGGFKNYFGWRLNRLMKFYTNHATEPAQALVVSVYIILGFGVFYFFFPSEWDIESKGKLVAHYRDFIKKNDKGYVKPFMKLTWGFVVSLINAITLSLNAFVTLGFGNIPTMGLARYVCILQGFFGWFLLSIFTVALFNQVLF